MAGEVKKENKIMSKNGQLTAATALFITDEMNRKGFDVYYDHGTKGHFVGTIPVSTEEELTSKNQISQLDIAVVEKDTYRAVALIEIEETTETPKTLIGDIFATLMGNSIHLPDREKKVKVGNWTTLIILGKGAGHDNRIKQVENIANNVKSTFGTGNSQIGKIVTEAFSEDNLLKDVLMEKINEAIQRSA